MTRPAKTGAPSRPRREAKKKSSHLPPILHTVEETMGLLRVGRTTLWGLTTDGALPSVKIGARVLYRRSDIEKFISKHVERA